METVKLDLTQYMRNRTEREAIEKLFDARKGNVLLYSVVASLYNDAAKCANQSEFETAIPHVFNSNEFFSRNYAPAEEKFLELYSKLRNEHIGGLLNKQKEKKGECTLNFSTFSVMPEGNLDFLNLGYSKGWAAWAVGNNLYLGLKKINVPLEKIVYSDENNAMCCKIPIPMSGGNKFYCIPIVLD